MNQTNWFDRSKYCIVALISLKYICAYNAPICEWNRKLWYDDSQILKVALPAAAAWTRWSCPPPSPRWRGCCPRSRSPRRRRRRRWCGRWRRARGCRGRRRTRRPRGSERCGEGLRRKMQRVLLTRFEQSFVSVQSKFYSKIKFYGNIRSIIVSTDLTIIDCGKL